MNSCLKVGGFVSGAGGFEGRGFPSGFGIGFASGAGGGGGGPAGGGGIFRPEELDDPPVSFPTEPLGVSGFAFGAGLGGGFDGFDGSSLLLLAPPLFSRQGGLGGGPVLSGVGERLGFQRLLPYLKPLSSLQPYGE